MVRDVFRELEREIEGGEHGSDVASSEGPATPVSEGVGFMSPDFRTSPLLDPLVLAGGGGGVVGDLARLSAMTEGLYEALRERLVCQAEIMEDL